jgi:tetratricopeptide (TPR) repeat protein
MTERLADAYVRCGDYDSAIGLFEQLAASGAPQFHIMQDLAILLQNTGDLDRAAAVLEQLTDAFPNDYRVPMRQAYLEADRQAYSRAIKNVCAAS